MISLCCQLCKQIGFRATRRVLPLMGQWLGVELKVPSRGAMRNWCGRHGVAILQQSCQQADDWIWLVDHHVPIGNMVALVILGIRQSDLPTDRPLRRSDMKPLAVVPSKSRRKEDVEQALVELTDLNWRSNWYRCRRSQRASSGRQSPTKAWFRSRFDG